ncbi:MAG: RidA family protein [SAR324 cluster bacterium]|nr:RidA family protein [SAR324 cluster bacterium]MCZ6646271.1 RidA family protein [SAR324 cluster bacterium]MCZ6843216.1 RidA family protein [SAR324 cluster bacterium]
MAHEIIHPDSVHPTKGYSHVARSGNMALISGQVAQDKAGNLVGVGDFAAQARQVFRNLKSITEELGGGLGNIAKINVYLTDPRNIEDYRAVRDEFMGEPYPASTLVIIDGLARPEWMIEVEATVFLDA